MFLKTFAKSWKTSHTPTQVQPADVGGTPDLQNAFEKLGPHNSMSDRIMAANIVAKYISKYSVSSISEIWVKIADMLDQTNSLECRRTGLKLVIKCIEQDRVYDSDIARTKLYKSIVSTSNVQDFDLDLEAIKALTRNGSEADIFFMGAYNAPRVIENWIRVLYSSVSKIRTDCRDVDTPPIATIEKNFFSLLDFVNTVYEKNSHLFEPQDTINLISRLCKTCKTTSSDMDISSCFKIIETIQRTSVIPFEILTDLLEILCGTLVMVETCRDQSRNIILNLADSELKITVFITLLNMIGDITTTRNIARGAIRTVQILLERAADSERDSINYSIQQVMHAYGVAARRDSRSIVFELISCIYDMLSNELCRKKFFTYVVWDSLTNSPLTVLYYISKGNIFQSLKSKHMWNEPYTLDTNPIGNDKHVEMVKTWKKILAIICQFYESDDFNGLNDTIVSYFVDVSPFIDEKCAMLVIDHFRKSEYCNPLDTFWLENLSALAKNFFSCELVNRKMTPMWSTEVRLKVAQLTCDVYELAKELNGTDTLKYVLSLVFDGVIFEPDLTVLSFLIDKSVEISGSALLIVMDYLSDCFMKFFDGPTSQAYNTRRQSIGSVTSSFMGLSIASSSTNFNRPPSIAPTSISEGTLAFSADDQRRRLVSIGFCQIFVRTFRIYAENALSVYDRIISIAKNTAQNDPVSFLEAARLLFRIRATTEGYIYLTHPTNMDGLSAGVGRNVNVLDSATTDTSSMMWWYPETVSYLQEKDLNCASRILKRQSQTMNDRSKKGYIEIDVRKHFDEIMRIIENGAHWEAYSFIWSHFGSQLSNLELFQPAGCNISRLRQTVVSQLNNMDRLPHVEFPRSVSRSDVLVTLARTISALIPYRDVFTKNDCDEIVQTLSNGVLGEKTDVVCIHGLMVCCHEFPLSIKKYLGQIFTRFQTKVTNIQTAPHILEFLLSLSRLPTLADNFTQDEYKRVFGMAFTYLNSPLNVSIQPTSSSSTTSDDVASSVMSPLLYPPPTLGHIPVYITSTTVLRLSQYILSLAYNVIVTWFLTLRIENRKYLAKYITRNLIRASGSNEIVDGQGMAYIDLISRFTFSDIDLTVQAAINSPSSSDPNRILRQWIYGNSIVTIDTDPQSGESFIVIRRPTGTAIFNMTPDSKMIPSWLEEDLLVRKGERSSEIKNQGRLRHEPTTALTPNYIILQVMYPPDTGTIVKPLVLPNDPIVSRAIGAFDRVPVVDFHKVGVLYIGPGQQNEQDILSNQVGSPRYRKFLDRLGKLVRLKGNKRIYSGGLDTNNNVDGEYAYVWSDKVTQMIFHTTTMMPHTNSNDSSYSSKKRHVGNDFINIFFDESELPFQFDIIKSQFNFINIVITPVSINFSKNTKFLVDEDITRSPNLAGQVPGPQMSQFAPEDRMLERTFFKVRAHRKPELPALFAGSHIKILSEDSVADFVRNLALIASNFAAIWNSDGQYKSNWQRRYDEIEALKQKVDDLVANKGSNNKHSQQTQKQTGNYQQNNRDNSNTDSAGSTSAGPSVPDNDADISSSFLSQLQTPAAGPVGFGSSSRAGDSSDANEADISSSFLSQLQTPGAGPVGFGSSSRPGDSSDANESPKASNMFVMEENDQDNFPLLNSLEFTSFTQ